jgi:hypothetical protein
MNRLVSAGSVISDQLAVYNPPNTFTRPVGLVVSDFSLIVFANNEELTWNLLDGTSVLNSAISPGSIYFNEISTNPGYYAIRWYPDRIGYWNLSLTCSLNSVEYLLQYDVVPNAFFNNPNQGLIASFY